MASTPKTNVADRPSLCLFSLLVFPLLLITQCLQSAERAKPVNATSLAQESRDPRLWPFSQESIWNLPIGANAVYVDAQVQPSTQRGMTVDEDILILAPSAPLTDIYENFVAWNDNSEGARCEPEGALIGQFPIPTDFLRGQPQGTTENNAVAILMPDGRTLKQNQPFTRCTVGGPATSLAIYPDVDLYGDGAEGAHGGSGLSSIGGTIRLGELMPGSIIRHVLKVNLYSAKNYYYAEDETDGQPGFRWPAVKADSVAGETYQGTNPAVQMGSLLALHRDLDLATNALGLETEPARLLAQAFQDYGAYVVDDTAWDVYAIATEFSPAGSVLEEFEATWGFPFDIADKDTPWGRDMDRIFTNLYVIDNNGPQSIGGGGLHRAPLAPPLVAPNATATPQPDPTATLQPQPTSSREPITWLHLPLITNLVRGLINPTATPTVIPTVTSTVTSTVTPVSEQTTLVTYLAEPDDFPNPERGFHDNIELIDESDLSWVVENGYTLARTYIRLDDYRETALPEELLDRIERGFNAARSAGIKLIPRFAYNFPGEDYESAEDASLEQVLAHINQLAPIFAAHADVIAVQQAGFIGAWGEWHTSSNDLDTPENRAIILDALLDALPADRMVQLRYPGDLLERYPDALSEAEAYSRSNQARTGHHNDCFLASEDDVGTYFPPEQTANFRQYLAEMTPWVAVGGETCQANEEAHRTDCPTTLAELERFHWSYLNEVFFAPDIQRWKDEGCYDEIRRRLGYRFRLIQTVAPQRAKPGTAMTLAIEMVNDGWSLPYNPRGAELILISQNGGGSVTIPLDQEDPRSWLPDPGESETLQIMANLPLDMAVGTYDLYLNFPDPAPLLYQRAAYSIRLANQNLWNSQTGYNALQVTVQIE